MQPYLCTVFFSLHSVTHLLSPYFVWWSRVDREPHESCAPPSFRGSAGRKKEGEKERQSRSNTGYKPAHSLATSRQLQREKEKTMEGCKRPPDFFRNAEVSTTSQLD